VTAEYAEAEDIAFPIEEATSHSQHNEELAKKMEELKKNHAISPNKQLGNCVAEGRLHCANSIRRHIRNESEEKHAQNYQQWQNRST